MKTIDHITPLFAALLALNLAIPQPGRAESENDVEHIKITEGQIVYEIIGEYKIGRVGDIFRTTKNGHLNATGSSPTGWFAGYSLGAGRGQKVDRPGAKAEK